MKTFCLTLLLALLSLTSAARAAQPERPNFVFIYTDDHRWDAMSVVQREQGDRARFPWFKTPNMDRLAAEGIRFRNAFCTISLCAPSRAVFLTGRYSHLNGVANNHTPFPIDNVTHATVLRAAGYKTAYIGKWHMGSQSGQRPGFDFSASYIGHGRYQDCPFEINGVSQPTTGWVDDVATDFAIGFIRTNKAGPFSLVLGFKSPHDPRTPPDRWKNAFAGEKCRPAINENARPPYFRPNPASRVQTNPHESASRLNYFRCIAAADENLGRILTALDQIGIAENTMVIYASDNGYYLGDHGLADKRSAYDESLRIPLLVRYPKSGLKGVLMDEPVLNLDLAPTLIDLAGLKPPKEMQGLSWRPLLERKDNKPLRNWRTSFFYEYFFERNFAIPTVFAVRTDSHKLIQYPGHENWTEIFDLKTDPYETNNLATAESQKNLRQKMEAEFNSQAKKVEFRIPDYADKPDAPAPDKPRRKKAARQ